MAEMYAGATPSTTNACSSSSSPPPPPPEQDDISLFLHQILLRSSSSPGGFPGKQAQQSSQHHPAVQTPGPDQISTGIGVLPSSTGVYVPAGNVSSSSAGTIDNDPDDYDCESEEGFENLVEEMGARPAAPRNPSKRSRAAEVHNLSEKRRRSRINEKMKALQKLIPNSNKTDKASMLDEAIEYLKQLQLQVQMLTMRNGLGLYPMCTPGRLQPNQLSHLRMGFNEQNGSLNMNLAGLISSNQGTLRTSILGPPIQCTNPNQPPPLPDFPHVINPESAFRLDSSIQAQHGPFQIHKSSEEICRDGLLPHPQIDTNHTQRNSSDFQMGVNPGIFGRDQPDSLQLTNSGIDTSTSAEAVKGERRTF